jgi:hypothetical protein
MYQFFQKTHSGWAYLLLLILIIAFLNAAIGYFSKKEFTSKDRKIALFALVFTHIQLLIGIVVYFLSPVGLAVLGEMKNADLRLTSLEHPLTNIIAIILITIGWSKHKSKTTGLEKFKTFFIFYGLGLFLLLLKIPWKMWF